MGIACGCGSGRNKKRDGRRGSTSMDMSANTCISKLECLYFKHVNKYYSTILDPLQRTGQHIGSKRKRPAAFASHPHTPGNREYSMARPARHIA